MVIDAVVDEYDAREQGREPTLGLALSHAEWGGRPRGEALEQPHHSLPADAVTKHLRIRQQMFEAIKRYCTTGKRDEGKFLSGLLHELKGHIAGRTQERERWLQNSLALGAEEGENMSSN
jgi:hypothetical protein